MSAVLRSSACIASAFHVECLAILRRSRSPVAPNGSAASPTRLKIPSIGHVTRTPNGGFKGQLNTLSVRTEIDIIPNDGKSSDTQPDYRVRSDGIEVGAR